MTSIDYLVIAVYGSVIAWLGVIAGRRSTNVDEYFAAGHRLPRRRVRKR